MIDFAPLYRSTVGFDRMLDMLDGLSAGPVGNAWPPYDIERIGDDQYRITVAVAGFSQANLWVIAGPNGLLIEGRGKDEDGQRIYLHQGIARRPFRHEFYLADFVKVSGATLENGLLCVDLEREIPEVMKPRRINISSNGERDLDNRSSGQRNNPERSGAQREGFIDPVNFEQR